MTLEYVLTILENKLSVLHSQKNSAIQAGELEQVARIDAEIVEVEATVAKIRSVL